MSYFPPSWLNFHNLEKNPKMGKENIFIPWQKPLIIILLFFCVREYEVFEISFLVEMIRRQINKLEK